MNIKKGMERIALIIAIVAIVPGLILGGSFVEKKCKTETTEHKLWQKKIDGWHEANPNWDKARFVPFKPWQDYSNKEWKEPRRYKDPPNWQIVLGSIVVASLSFFIVLFGIRGTTRLIMWVVAGFRGKGKEV